jgi:peroxiredoxin
MSGMQARYRLVGPPAGSLVVAMSATCGFCQQSLDAWRRLSSKARRLGVQVVWVSRDTTRGKAGGEVLIGLDDSLIADPTHSTYVQLRMSTVPQTLIVQNDGVVKDVRAGVVDAAVETSLSNSIDAMAHGRR